MFGFRAHACWVFVRMACPRRARGQSSRARCITRLRLVRERMNFKDFSFSVRFTPPLREKSCLIKKVPRRMLGATIYAGSYENPKAERIPIGRTPHYAFIRGDRQPYLEYMSRYREKVGGGIEHSPSRFERLIEELKHTKYLEHPYNENYIICEEIRTLFARTYRIMDGVHRAAYYAS